MLQLFKTELKKFRPNSTIMLLVIFFTALTPFAILAIKGIFKDSSGPVKVLSEIYDLPMIWEYQGYATSWFVFFFLGFMVLQMFTSEVSNKTMRQNIITGYTKREYFTAKVVVILILALAATALYTISSVAIGAFHTPGWDFDLLIDNNWAITRFFISSVGTLFFALLVATVFRKGGLSMFIYFSYPLVLEPIMRWLTVYAIVKADKPSLTIMNYFPMNTLEDLFVFPLIRTTNDFFNVKEGMTFVHSQGNAMIFGSIYALIFLALAWRSFKNSDI